MSAPAPPLVELPTHLAVDNVLLPDYGGGVISAPLPVSVHITKGGVFMFGYDPRTGLGVLRVATEAEAASIGGTPGELEVLEVLDQ